MDNIAKSILKDKISSFNGTYFQDSLDKIFQIIYNDDFTQIKQKRDQGCDGIINNDTIIAAYAPEKYSLADFKKKIGEDFVKYKKNWCNTHPNWKVVCNLEMTSSMYKFISSLKSDTTSLCINGLVEKIREQSWSKIFLVFESLDIPTKYLSNDIFGIVIRDVISNAEKTVNYLNYEKPIYIEEKAKLNISIDDVQSFMDEYEESFQHFTIIKETLKSHKSIYITSLRSKIRSTYQGLSGSFHEKIKMLTEVLAPNNTADDLYMLHVRVLVIYFFEQCLYGKKTETEIENA